MANQYTRYDANDPRAAGRGIPADVLAQLLAGKEVPGWSTAYAPKTIYQGGDAGDYYIPNAGYTEGPEAFQYKDPSKEWYSTYDPSGALMNEGNGNNKMTTKDYLTYLALVAGAGALGGAGGAAAGGAEAGGMTAAEAWGSGAGLGGDTLSAMGTTGGNGLLGAGSAGGGMTAAEAWGSGAGLGGDTLGAMGASGGTAGAGGAAAGSGLGGLWDAAKSVVSPALSSLTSGNGSTLGGLLGAGLGALSSKDETTSRDPWAPAQDFMKQQISQGQQLSKKYQEQPFSQQQQTAYNNIGGLLNAINTMAPQLIGGYAANASGQNQYSRANPTRGLIGSNVMATNPQWNPGAFNFFQQGGK
jgi:hypothetical protein